MRKFCVPCANKDAFPVLYCVTFWIACFLQPLQYVRLVLAKNLGSLVVICCLLVGADGMMLRHGFGAPAGTENAVLWVWLLSFGKKANTNTVASVAVRGSDGVVTQHTALRKHWRAQRHALREHVEGDLRPERRKTGPEGEDKFRPLRELYYYKGFPPPPDS